MISDDIASLLATTPAADTGQPDFGWHQGLVVEWNAAAGTNKIRVAGVELEDLAVLTSAGSVSLEPGAVVGILRYRSSYFVLGRVVLPGSGLAQPMQPVPMYPQFAYDTALGANGYPVVPATMLTAWEGRARANLPYIEIDGIWGVVSGSGSVTYEVRLGGVTYGAATFTTFAGATRLGPFDIRDRIGLDWERIEVVIAASTGTGYRAFGMLGTYFRQP